MTCCFKSDKNLVNFDLITQEPEKFAKYCAKYLKSKYSKWT